MSLILLSLLHVSPNASTRIIIPPPSTSRPSLNQHPYVTKRNRFISPSILLCVFNFNDELRVASQASVNDPLGKGKARPTPLHRLMMIPSKRPQHKAKKKTYLISSMQQSTSHSMRTSSKCSTLNKPYLCQIFLR
uniref:Uncharacterized protein n=1 Tax=Cucumis melo TaxID=3656 RepID=A0A9I9EHF3_CUCME